MDKITLVKDAIHRPDEPRHFMQFKYPEGEFIATIGSLHLAKTKNALALSEVGYGIYDPVIYFPLTDVNLDALNKIGKSTHCPLKGDTEYYDLKTGAGNHAREIAWRYSKPLAFAAKLADYIAFDSKKVHIQKQP